MILPVASTYLNPALSETEGQAWQGVGFNTHSVVEDWRQAIRTVNGTGVTATLSCSHRLRETDDAELMTGCSL